MCHHAQLFSSSLLYEKALKFCYSEQFISLNIVGYSLCLFLSSFIKMHFLCMCQQPAQFPFDSDLESQILENPYKDDYQMRENSLKRSLLPYLVSPDFLNSWLFQKIQIETCSQAQLWNKSRSFLSDGNFDFGVLMLNIGLEYFSCLMESVLILEVERLEHSSLSFFWGHWDRYLSSRQWMKSLLFCVGVEFIVSWC